MHGARVFVVSGSGQAQHSTETRLLEADEQRDDAYDAQDAAQAHARAPVARVAGVFVCVAGVFVCVTSVCHYSFPFLAHHNFHKARNNRAKNAKNSKKIDEQI